MAKGDWWGFLSSAILVVIPAPAHSGELTKGDRAAFAIRPVGGSGDVKTRLWSGVNVAAIAPDYSIKCDESSPCYPWKMGIVATVFWIGETGSGPTNARSAWDKDWLISYGGVDDPVRRRGYWPAGFRPLQNPFYVALPYCDMWAGRLKPEAAKVVPWFIQQFRGLDSSVCKGHWVEIRQGPRICYAQWEDVGPFCTDSAGYVFGDERPSPNVNHAAGIDVSPAVRDYLGLKSLDLVDWRFVEMSEVPSGPWSRYGCCGAWRPAAKRTVDKTQLEHGKRVLITSGSDGYHWAGCSAFTIQRIGSGDNLREAWLGNPFFTDTFRLCADAAD